MSNDVSYLFHRARCDSDDGSMSSSTGKVPRLVEREIIDSSDEESQASSGSFDERMKRNYYVGQVFMPTRMETKEDRSEVGSARSECSDSSKKMPPVKRLKLEDSSSSEGSDSGEEEDLRGCKGSRGTSECAATSNC